MLKLEFNVIGVGNAELDKHIPDADILITTPFHPAYMT